MPPQSLAFGVTKGLVTGAASAAQLRHHRSYTGRIAPRGHLHRICGIVQICDFPLKIRLFCPNFWQRIAVGG
jgi:hypothetical protein